MNRPVSKLRINDDGRPDYQVIQIDDMSLNELIHELDREVDEKKGRIWGIEQKWRLDRDELRRTLKGNGNVEIMTCTCGVPECLGIRPVRVDRSSETIIWQLSSSLDRSSEINKTAEFTFHLPQYCKEIESRLGKAES